MGSPLEKRAFLRRRKTYSEASSSICPRLSAMAGMGSIVFGWYSTSPSKSAMWTLASGWPELICGSSDSGSEPEM
jgi:hypothetical protein